MVLGATMLIDAPVPELRIPLQSAVVLTAPFALILVFLTALVVRARRVPSSCGPEAAPGQTAVALTALTPYGRVLFHGESWNAHASTPIEAETDVRVKAIHGLELEVEPATAPGPVVRKAQTGG
jgi:membrane-bound ClpP family serine protease